MRRDPRLHLLATEGTPPPGDELREFLSRHVKEKAIASSTIVDIPDIEESMTTVLAEQFGVTKPAVFLLDENRRPVALAVLMGAAATLQSPLELAEALGAFLVGDVDDGETLLSRG